MLKPWNTLLFMGLFWSAHFYRLTVGFFYSHISSLSSKKHFSHISDWLLHSARGICWRPSTFSWCWQTLQSVNRFDMLIVFQRITPTPNTSTLTLVFVCLTFTLTLSLSVRAKKNDFSARSFPIFSSTVSNKMFYHICLNFFLFSFFFLPS